VIIGDRILGVRILNKIDIVRNQASIQVGSIGVLDEAAWKSSVDILTTYKIIKDAPSEGAYRTDLAKAALDFKPDAK